MESGKGPQLIKKDDKGHKNMGFHSPIDPGLSTVTQNVVFGFGVALDCSEWVWQDGHICSFTKILACAARSEFVKDFC